MKIAALVFFLFASSSIFSSELESNEKGFEFGSYKITALKIEKTETVKEGLKGDLTVSEKKKEPPQLYYRLISPDFGGKYEVLSFPWSDARIARYFENYGLISCFYPAPIIFYDFYRAKLFENHDVLIGAKGTMFLLWYPFFLFTGTHYISAGIYNVRKNGKWQTSLKFGYNSVLSIKEFIIKIENGSQGTDGTSRYGINLLFPNMLKTEDPLWGHRLVLGTRLPSFALFEHQAYPGYLIDWGWSPDINLTYGYQGKRGGIAFTGAFQVRYYKPYDFQDIAWSSWSGDAYFLNMRYEKTDYRQYKDKRSYQVYKEMYEMYEDMECMTLHDGVCIHKGQTDWWEYGARLDSLFYFSFAEWAWFYLAPFYQWTSVAPGSNHRFGSGWELDFNIYGPRKREAIVGVAFNISISGAVAYHYDDDRYSPVSSSIFLNLSFKDDYGQKNR